MKLITGEEIVAKKDPELVQGGHMFQKLRSFHAVQDPQTGQVRAGLMPWLMSDPDAEVMIANQHIIAMVPASSEMEKAYLQQTSGLDLSSKMGV